MKKQIIRKLCLNNDIIDLIEPVYINVKGNNVQVLARVINELNNQIRELKEQMQYNPFNLEREQIDKICEYLQKKYPPDNYMNDYSYGVNCACSHCPFGDSRDGYGKVWDCMAYMARTHIEEELVKVIKGEEYD